MELLYSITALRVTVIVVVVCCTGWSFAEKRLLCSSESMSIWYEVDELYFYYLSANMSHCYIGMTDFTLAFTVIPMYTAVHVGYSGVLLYKNKTWMEFSNFEDPCEDVKVCEVIKGETIHESYTISIRPYYIPAGEYLFSATAYFTDDLERESSVNLKIIMHVRHNGRDDPFHHLGVL